MKKIISLKKIFTKKAKKEMFILFLIYLLLLFYRFVFALTPSWHSDESTNIWLSYLYKISETPVGTLSSQYIPNPNGLLFLIKPLTMIEDLITVSLFLSLFQLICISLFVYNFPIKTNKLLLFFTLSFSLLLTNSSVHLWNQWIVLNFNLLFFSFYFKYKESKNFNNLIYGLYFGLTSLTIYLGSFVSVIIFIVIFLVEIFNLLKHRKVSFIPTKNLIFSTLLFFYYQFYIVWIPYFKQVSIYDIKNISNISLMNRVEILIENFLDVPGLILVLFTKFNSFFIFLLDPGQTSLNLNYLFRFFVIYHKLLVSCALFLLIFFSQDSKTKKIFTFEFKILLCYIFFFLLLSPLFGGSDFSTFERFDKVIELYPFYITLIFLVFFHSKDIFNKIKLSIFIIFILLNISIGFLMSYEAIMYKGSYIGDGDVTIYQKQQLSEALALDINSNNIKEATISYQLGAGKFEWIVEHSEAFKRYYDKYPFTIGRYFDYVLFKKYNISNLYEGVNNRNYSDAQYIISYTSIDPRYAANLNYEEILFGQLRLSILND